MKVPKEWPIDIADSYDPIRVLGTGGFASIVLARSKSQSETSTKKVAIKVMGSNGSSSSSEENDSRLSAALYAQREIQLLEQIHHANIVGLIGSWYPKEQERVATTSGVLVLEYAKGPTLDSLLRHGGALSNTFGRVIIAQVMDAVSYLHFRAVVHRDIKPDNIIVSGALSSDDSIWDNTEDVGGNPHIKSTDEWKRLCFKYKVTLIDFGFARALTPDDMEKSEVYDAHSMNASYHDIVEDPVLLQQISKASGGLRRRLSRGVLSVLDALDVSFHGRGSGSLNLDDSEHSISHKLKRVMSTLGNRNYAAPEIIDQVRPQSQKEKNIEQKHGLCDKTTKTISSFVADYGLLVDSYSLGHTIRYMMTGVQPGVSIDDVLRKQGRAELRRSTLSKVGLIKQKKNKDKPIKRKPYYRSMEDLPGPLYQLIVDLTRRSERKRISIRKARRTVPWISDVLSFQNSFQNSFQKGTDGLHDGKSATEQEEIESSQNSGAPSSQQQLSLGYVSEEQYHALHENRYLSLATPSTISSGGTNKTALDDNDDTSRSSSNTSPGTYDPCSGNPFINPINDTDSDDGILLF